MTRQIKLFIVVVVLGFSAIGYYDFLYNWEQVEEKIHHNRRGKARTHLLYAAEQFLQKIGHHAEAIDSLDALNNPPSIDDVVIMDSMRVNENPTRAKKWIDWIARGGTLIVQSSRDIRDFENYSWQDDQWWEKQHAQSERYMHNDPLLKEFGIGYERMLKSSADELEQQPINFYAPSIDDFLLIEIQSFTYLEGLRENEIIASLGSLPIAGEIQHGAGKLIIVTDLTFLETDFLQRYDHVHLLWEWTKNADKIWLVNNDDMPSFAFWLWQRGPELLISSGLIMLFWLIGSSLRIGPISSSVAPIRRSLLEHIQASGYFLWNKRSLDELLQANREQIQNRMLRHHPAWLQLNEQQREHHLATLLDWPAEQIARVLHAPSPHNSDDFTQLIQQLNRIRKLL